jgi:hypothetical protein
MNISAPHKMTAYEYHRCLRGSSLCFAREDTCGSIFIIENTIILYKVDYNI